ncbi:hypothetical protein SDC9_137221 [bioreactor metagenome]|uniref:Uncharacterized protein n=1 Tax=bioreactor metagenome TaxID=1076179 RepID=A0A645DKY0_9ZZZZ
MPAIDLDPLARLQVLIVLEEVRDLLAQQFRRVFVGLDVVVQRGQLGHRNGEQLGVFAAFVGHR